MGESMLLHFVEHRLQEVALVIMATVYAIRLIWLFRFKFTSDRQARTGRLTTSPQKGAVYSLFNIAMPWSMESTRKDPFFYGQFVGFHIGVATSIALSFIIPYWPHLLESRAIVFITRLLIGAALIVGCMRFVRRVTNPVMKAISTPDDYFSLALLIVWFFFAFLSVPNNIQSGEWHLFIYFLLTAFFLIYVPFSKISHYLYYPFTRYWLGKTLGHRGVFPIERHPKVVKEVKKPTLEGYPVKEKGIIME